VSEVVFQGTSAIALDAKGRITVPVRQRDQLMQACEGRLTLVKDVTGFLRLIPRPRWEAMRERLLALPLSNDAWRRAFIGSAVDVEIDAAARILVPPELRAAAGLVNKEVLLIGNGHVLELWDAGRHATEEAKLLSADMPPEIQSLVL